MNEPLQIKEMKVIFSHREERIIYRIRELRNEGGIMKNCIFCATDVVSSYTRWAVFWRGLLVLVMGILFILKPMIAAVTLSFMFGWGFVAGGIWIIISACIKEKNRLVWGIYGVLLTLCGVLLIANPLIEFLVLAWTVAGLLMTGSVISLATCMATGTTAGQNIFIFTMAVLGILLSGMLIIWPFSGLSEMVWAAGILITVEGGMLIGYSFKLPTKKQEEEKLRASFHGTAS